MMFWAIYFIVVAYLQIFGAISAHAFLNLTLCLFVFFPLPDKLPKKKLVNIIRSIVGVILGIALLYHESYLPAPMTLWTFLFSPELRPSPTFIWNFLISALNIKVLLFALPTLIFAYVISYTRFKKYFPLFFILVFFTVGFTEQTATYDDLVGNFYQLESKKTVTFDNNKANDFDIVILQICSFSWDDFNYINYDMKPFFSKFDYVFTDFNSVASYSNPAVLRLLHSTCGQTTEGDLFTPSNDNCYLMTNLRKLGYKTSTVLNHDGIYSGFTDAITKYGRADIPLDNSKLTPIQTSFDGSPVYRDSDALALWSKNRDEDQNNKEALIYNSITLHTGGKYIGGTALDNSGQYSLALKNLVFDLDNFFAEIKKSNRRTIVIVIGEHGAALRGSALQPGTVREIPLPNITTVPVAIKMFGPEFNDKNGAGIVISQPSTYIPLMETVAQIIKTQKVSTVKLSDSRFIAENQNDIVIKTNFGLFYKLKKYKTWDLIPGSIAQTVN